MSSGANGEWVRQGTPRDDNADWNEEQSEYGTAVSPTEWDDYSNEQSVPVTPPRAQSEDAGDSVVQPESDPVPGQEPDAEREYRSDEIDPLILDEPVGDADDHGMEPVRLDEPGAGQMDDASVAEDDDDVVDHEPFADLDETPRPRPVVPGHVEDDAEGAGVMTDEPASSDDRHLDAAEYLAVDPEPVDTSDSDRDAHEIDDEPTQQGGTHDMDDEPTQVVEVDDMEATQAIPVAPAAAVGATTASTSPVPDGLYRSAGIEDTSVIAHDEYPNNDADVEEERQQAQLEAERQAREQRLGAVPTSTDNALREDVGPARVTTDRFLPSFGLFVTRIVVAGVLGLASFQILGSGVDATANFLGGYPMIPEPRLVAWILGFTLGAMALLLVIGLLQRVVGFLLLVISVATLVFIRWGNFAIFTSGGVWVEGFIGDKDLLLAAIGLLLLTIGGGAWGIDGAFRRARAASKAERQG